MDPLKQRLQAITDRKDESGYDPFAQSGTSSPQMGQTVDWIQALRHPINTFQDFSAYSDPNSPQYQNAKDLKNQLGIDYMRTLQAPKM